MKLQGTIYQTKLFFIFMSVTTIRHNFIIDFRVFLSLSLVRGKRLENVPFPTAHNKT